MLLFFTLRALQEVAERELVESFRVTIPDFGICELSRMKASL